MKEILLKRVKQEADARHQYNVLRESLQHLLLKIIDDTGYFKHISFMGGTALRILFDLQRYSEDLDFCLHDPVKFEFNDCLATICQHLTDYGLSVDTKQKNVGAVKNVFFRFNDILQDFGISQRRGQKLSIKFEIDTNPLEHAILESRLVQKDFLFSVVHHDLSTLFAGKLLACLFRTYTKGRDVYDLIWYLTRKTPVNRAYLESGLKQATGKVMSWSETELKAAILEKLSQLNLSQVADDVEPFLDDPSEVKFFTKELVVPLIDSIRYAES